jgi:RimJ/RimL family protein N-acetyltransferase
MRVEPTVLEGHRVLLEPMTEGHADALVVAGCGFGLSRYFPISLETEGDMRAWVHESVAALAAGTSLAFVTVDRATGTVVGSTSYLAIERQHRRLEIGSTWVTPDHQRTFVNTEAKYLQLSHCFEVLGCNRVELKTDERNAASRAAIARIGATEEGTFRAHMVMPDGHLRNTVWFSILAAEWPATKARLLNRLRPE